MKVFNLCLLASLLLLTFGACQQSALDMADMQSYIEQEQNGLSKNKSIGPVDININYRPNDFLVAQELRRLVSTPKTVDSLRSKYASFAYFDLQLSVGGQEIESYIAQRGTTFGSSVQTLAFDMSNQLLLTTDQNDTIPVFDYQYQRTFGAGKSTSLLFVYDRKQLEAAQWIQFDLADFGLGIGHNRFRFNIADLKRSPAIQFEN